MKEITDLRQLQIGDDLEITILWSKIHEDAHYFKVKELQKHKSFGVLLIYHGFEVEGDQFTSIIYQKDDLFYFTTINDAELNHEDIDTIEDFGFPTFISRLENHHEIKWCKQYEGR